MKKVELGTVSVDNGHGYGADIYADGAQPIVYLRAYGLTRAVAISITDPAKLDALADACKRAADALSKARQTTFGDLKVGTFFRAKEIWPQETMLKTTDDNAVRLYHCIDVTFRADDLVAPLKATFEAIDE